MGNVKEFIKKYNIEILFVIIISILFSEMIMILINGGDILTIEEKRFNNWVMNYDSIYLDSDGNKIPKTESKVCFKTSQKEDGSYDIKNIKSLCGGISDCIEVGKLRRLSKEEISNLMCLKAQVVWDDKERTRYTLNVLPQ